MNWFCQKTKGGIRCLQEHGIAYTLKRVKEKALGRLAKPLEKIKSHALYRIWSTFHSKVMRGYEIYEEEVNKYGEDTTLLFTATSRGDAYILGSLLEGFTDICKFPKKWMKLEQRRVVKLADTSEQDKG